MLDYFFVTVVDCTQSGPDWASICFVTMPEKFSPEKWQWQRQLCLHSITCMPVQRCSYVKSQEADIEDVFLFFHPTRLSRQERRLAVIIYSGCLAWSFLFPCRKCDIMMMPQQTNGWHACRIREPRLCAATSQQKQCVFTAKEQASGGGC